MQYKATDFVVPGAGKMEVKWVSSDGKETIAHTVFDFPAGGVALAMYNTDAVRATKPIFSSRFTASPIPVHCGLCALLAWLRPRPQDGLLPQVHIPFSIFGRSLEGCKARCSTKNTILKQYDGRFKDIFQEIYEK